MSTPTPRIRLSAREVAPGEIIDIRTMVSHPMETGNRIDPDGRAIPRNIIHDLHAEFDGQTVFRAALETSVSANPYLQFKFAPSRSGTLTLTWRGDDGFEVAAEEPITVT